MLQRDNDNEEGQAGADATNETLKLADAKRKSHQKREEERAKERQRLGRHPAE